MGLLDFLPKTKRSTPVSRGASGTWATGSTRRFVPMAPLPASVRPSDGYVERNPMIDPTDWLAGGLAALPKVGLRAAAGSIPLDAIGSFAADRVMPWVEDVPVLRAIAPIAASVATGYGVRGAMDDIARAGGPLRAARNSRLAEQRGSFVVYNGPPDAQRGQFSALHDRVPRVEVDDSGATFRELPLSPYSQDNLGKTVADYVGHPELTGQPYLHGRTLGDITMMSGNMTGERAAYVRNPFNNRPDDLGTLSFNTEDFGTTGRGGDILHELQHALQERGGMARGGSPEQMAKLRAQLANKMDFDTTVSALAREAEQNFSGNVDRAAIELNDLGIEVTPEHIQRLMKIGTKAAIKSGEESQAALSRLMGSGKGPQSDHDLYRRLAGEIEARDTAARMNLTADQRRRIQPLSGYGVRPDGTFGPTYDPNPIPLDDYIVRMGDGGPALSAGPGRRYYRYTRNPDTPDNGIGFTMWADEHDKVVVPYGDHGWEMEGADLPHISDIAESVRDSYLKALENYNLTASLEDMGESLLDEINPEGIVDSAGAWDVPEFVQWFFENIADPQEIKGVRTNDGAILFDQARAKRYSPD